MTVFVLFVVLVGFALGSFANVVIARVPAGQSVVTPPSACPQCGHAIRSRHNLPVVGWILLRGRCFDCTQAISVRYPAVEALTGLAFGVVAWCWGLSWESGLLFILAFFSITLSLIDLDTQRLPNVVTAWFGGMAGLYIGVWAVFESLGSELLRAAIGAIALGAIYFVAWFVYPKGMGFGDVKLAPVLGGILAWFGWQQLIVGGFAAFVWGALVGVGLMVILKRGRKLAIPFGPWMFAGAWTGIVVGPGIAEWYLTMVGLQ